MVAQSGLPKRWTIKLIDVRSHAGNIVRFRVDSYKAETDVPDLVEKNGRIYQPNLVEVFVNASSDAVSRWRLYRIFRFRKWYID